MANLYYKTGIHEIHSQFDHFFRDYPDYGTHKAGYCINAGLEDLITWVRNTRFNEDDIQYLGSITGSSGTRIFDRDFLSWLKNGFTFDSLTIDAIPEGRVVHPEVPLTVVKGQLAVAQILESPLLNKLNYPTLVATKAARIQQAGRGGLLLEFGMRRGPGEGVNSGIRAALIGGADFSSAVSISRNMGIPPKGTHSHSMVQVFMAIAGGEYEAFKTFADIYPDDCVLLVDTINTLESGIPNAIRVFEYLRRKGHKPVGIRLDSGDLAFLSIQASRMLDDAGFPDTRIVLSNQLDELVIWQIITQIEEEAAKYGVDPDKLISRLVYGVGTSLITSKGDPSLDGVYKLVAVKNKSSWVPAIKISETPQKTLIPGNKYIYRIYDSRGNATADVLSTREIEITEQKSIKLRHPLDNTKQRTLNRDHISRIEDLSEKILDEGKTVYEFPGLDEIRSRRKTDMEVLDPGVKRILNPHLYHVSLSEDLWELKNSLISSAGNKK